MSLNCYDLMSRGWDKEIQHSVLPVEQIVFSNKWARIKYVSCSNTIRLVGKSGIFFLKDLQSAVTQLVVLDWGSRRC